MPRTALYQPAILAMMKAAMAEPNHPAEQLNGPIGKWQMELIEVYAGEKDIAAFLMKCGDQQRPLSIRASRVEFAEQEFKDRVKKLIGLCIDKHVHCEYCQSDLIDDFVFVFNPEFVTGRCAKCNQRSTISLAQLRSV